MEKHIHLIAAKLTEITEGLGPFTQWLTDLCVYLIKYQCQKQTLDFFVPLIQSNLNAIFLHVIDPSYETTYSSEEVLRIHDGELNE